MSNSVKHSNAAENTPKTRIRKSVGSSFKTAVNSMAYMNEIFSAFRKMCEIYQCQHIPSPVNMDDDKKLVRLEDNPFKIYFGFKKVDGSNELEKIVFKSNGIESKVMFALKNWLEPYNFISTLKFEYCNLTVDDIDLLADILRTHSTIKELSLNGNPLEKQNHFLVLHDTQLFSLSLKLCNINAEGINKIAQELSIPTGHSLLHLNLASNNISKEGIKYVSQFLRINRSLLSLNVADNKLKSKECDIFTQPLQQFQLNQEDILIKRANQEVIKNSSKNVKKETIERLQKSVSAGAGVAKGTSSCSLTPELPYHPFVQDSYEEANEIYCTGNDNLSNINLSYNHITKEGIQRILDMLNYQMNNYANDKGISRISIEGNVLDGSARACDEIEELLTRKHFVTKQSNSRNSIKRNLSFT